MKLINIEDISALLNKIDFEDAYLKEAYYLSPTYFRPDAIVAPDHPGDLKVLLITNDHNFPAIELCFIEVTQFALSNGIDITPKIWEDRSQKHFSLISSEFEKISCREIICTILDKKYRSNVTRYSNDVCDSDLI